MNSLEEKIKEIEKQLEELKEQLKEESTKEDINYERKRLEKYEHYWYLDEFGEVGKTYEYYSKDDDFVYSIGNYFETEEQAENYKEKLLIEQELRDIAMELNKGEEIDWNNQDQEKYCLEYDFLSNSIGYIKYIMLKIQGAIYCLNENFKDVAIERIGEERLKKYLKGELD